MGSFGWAVDKYIIYYFPIKSVLQFFIGNKDRIKNQKAYPGNIAVIVLDYGLRLAKYIYIILKSKKNNVRHHILMDKHSKRTEEDRLSSVSSDKPITIRYPNIY